MTLRELMDAAEQNTLFRVYDGVCPEPFVFWGKDYRYAYDKIKEPLEPLLHRVVEQIRADKTEDPLSPKMKLATIWVDLGN